jgi:Fas apoptotic inhibitory molecule (FAIM1)
MGGIFTKNWQIEDGDEKHIVQLRHHNVSGRREVLIDNKVVHESTKFLDDGDRLPFELGDKKGEVVIDVGPVDFEYHLFFDGTEVQDMVSKRSDYKGMY